MIPIYHDGAFADSLLRNQAADFLPRAFLAGASAAGAVGSSTFDDVTLTSLPVWAPSDAWRAAKRSLTGGAFDSLGALTDSPPCFFATAASTRSRYVSLY